MLTRDDVERRAATKSGLNRSPAVREVRMITKEIESS
jgi:hypothetical protein